MTTVHGNYVIAFDYDYGNKKLDVLRLYKYVYTK